MKKQKNNFQTLQKRLYQTSEKELREIVYQNDLPYLIDQEIYSEYEKAKDWRLGALHKEWNNYLQQYQGLNIKAPRGHLKTFFFFEALALQQCRFKKNIEIRYFTGADSLAVEKLDHIKDFAKFPYFQELLRGADINNKTELKFANNDRIYVQGFWGKLRGGHPDVLILDDIIDTQVVYSDEQNKKSKERLASEILPMAEPNTQIIIIGTLQREDDIYSVDFEDLNSEVKWIDKSYDAIIDEEKKQTLFPEKWNWGRLMAKKKEITKLSGEKWFLKEYRNMAINLLGEIIKPEWIQWYDVLPRGLDIFTGWDLSVGKDLEKGDYAACITFGIDRKENIYIIRVFRARIDFPERLRKVVEFGRVDKPIKIKIENNAFQSDTVQTLITNTALPIEGITSTINKVQKFSQELAPRFENRKVLLKRGDPAHEDFRKELCSLPRGKYDDMADGLCIGLNGLEFAGSGDIGFWI